MLLNAVIIILREVIEASLIISIFLAFSQRFNLSRSWLLSIPLGVVFAIIYAFNINTISQYFDGVGQEVANAVIHTVVFTVLCLFTTFAVRFKRLPSLNTILALMFVGVTFASIREGSEIILYIHGFWGSPEQLKPVLIGGAIGSGIGVSVGIFFYYFFVNLPTKLAAKTGFLLCLLVAGGMVLQAVQLLTQADWIASDYPVWDTSNWVHEHSAFGQLLYALVGYEATPTLTQVISYFAAITSMSLLAYFSNSYSSRSNHSVTS
jgi:high-affinity iron transporter